MQRDIAKRTVSGLIEVQQKMAHAVGHLNQEVISDNARVQWGAEVTSLNSQIGDGLATLFEELSKPDDPLKPNEQPLGSTTSTIVQAEA